MDFPLPRRKLTWRDSTWWQATRLSLIAGVAMMVLALPGIAYIVPQIFNLAHMPVDSLGLAKEVLEGGLLMMPYLWVYFFALENLSRQRHEQF
jgi:polyferredoxin